MNELCTDIGFYSLNKKGEQLCGDNVEVIERDENSTVVVLADGLGSGVKANILGAETRNVDGRAYGYILLGLPDDADEAGRAMAYLSAQRDVTVEEVENYHA